jgi:CheY-like chemotaxis protein
MPEGERPPEPVSHERRWTALVADEALDFRAHLATMIHKFDPTIRVIGASNGIEARNLLLRWRPQLAFVNLQLPRMTGAEDGLETTCLVQDQMPEVRVVMVSASRNPAVEKAARYFGAVHFLKKPFFAREVDKAMHLAFDLPLTSFMLEPEKVESDQLELALLE